MKNNKNTEQYLSKTLTQKFQHNINKLNPQRAKNKLFSTAKWDLFHLYRAGSIITKKSM